ncbi:MAG TPA: hypothetical protein VFS41_06570 [Edaphobacter sp.]|nr:hypothetical protein [Edaphobacter sp.]
MKTATWLRSASVLTFVHAVTHTIGGVYAPPAPGPQQTAIDAMKANLFPVMGSMRTQWDFYHGMGLAVAIFLTAEAVVLWLLAGVTQKSTAGLQGVLVTFLLGYLALAAVSMQYFFLPPVIVELLIAGCLLMAILAIRQSSARGHSDGPF